MPIRSQSRGILPPRVTENAPVLIRVFLLLCWWLQDVFKTVLLQKKAKLLEKSHQGEQRITADEYFLSDRRKEERICTEKLTAALAATRERIKDPRLERLYQEAAALQDI